MRRVILLLLILLIPTTGIWAKPVKRAIVNMLTNYEVNPMNIEEPPVFSWQLTSEGYKVMQNSYRILVATSESALKNGPYVYDSGIQKSDESVCIPYKGQQLKPCTTYYWKVIVKANKQQVVSPTATFETALMNTGWNGAKWISSPKPQLSPYTSDVVVDYDLQMLGTCNSSTIVIAYADSLSYAYATLNVPSKGKSELLIGYKQYGKMHPTDTLDVSQWLNKKNLSQPHHIKMIARSDNFNAYCLQFFIDGNKTGNEIPLRFDQGRFYDRMRQMGFGQPKGMDAKYSNLTIRSRKRGVLRYAMDKPLTVKGTGALTVWQPGSDVSMPMFRKSFTVNGTVKRARLYATARGIYEMSLNGQPVSLDFFNPGWTEYHTRIFYNTFDITPLVRQGANAVSALLGEGWFSGFMGYTPEWADQYGEEQSLMAKIVIDYADGTQSVVVSDGSWKCYTQGPITANSLYSGEDYDARKEVKGWTEASFNDSQWLNAKTVKAPDDSIIIQPYVGQPVRIDTVCTAKSVSEPLPGTYIFDMGQNMVGVPTLKVKGKSGQRITIRYAEMKYPDIIPTKPVAPYSIDDYKKMKGQLYTDNLRAALVIDHYTCKGSGGLETVQPGFTFHGFRYIEITGVDTCPALEDVKVRVINSLPQKATCQYLTSDSLINRLYQNIVWGQRGNFLAVPTDCPQRDERLGWMGDAQIFSRTSTYNRMTDPFFRRWIITVRDCQDSQGNYSNFAPTLGNEGHLPEKGGGFIGWADAGLIIPWQLYQQYGDKALLSKHYASMMSYMDYIEHNAKDYIQPCTGYGDWVALLGTQSDLTNTCYFAYDAKLMNKMATALGKTEDANRFAQLFEKIKEAFNKRYADSLGNMISPIGSPVLKDSYSAAFNQGPKSKKPRILDSQTAYIMPLEMDLLDGKVKEGAINRLLKLIADNKYCLNTGFIGTPYLNLVLSENGHDDVAYKLFQQTAYPSWLYPVLQGATTIWERWNSYTIENGFGPVGMNSFNHYSYGAVQEWMMEYSAGIQRDEAHPAYKHFILQPRVGGKFRFIHASYDCMYGRIESGWDSKDPNADTTGAAGKGYTYKATVPANTTATLIIQNPGDVKVEVTMGKKGILKSTKENGQYRIELSSGQYVFEVM